jgi:hypothetical protein
METPNSMSRPGRVDRRDASCASIQARRVVTELAIMAGLYGTAIIAQSRHRKSA